MWGTKHLISPVKIRIFCPKTTKFGPKLAFLFILGQALPAYLVPCWWVVCMWMTKLFISPVKIRIFCPKKSKFGPKMAFLFILGQALLAHLVGGCGARAVSRKTPIYFISSNHHIITSNTIFCISTLHNTKYEEIFATSILLNYSVCNKSVKKVTISGYDTRRKP